MRAIGAVPIIAFAAVGILAASAPRAASEDLSGKRPAATSFHSPMRLETVLAAADRSLWADGGWFSTPEYHALGQSTCDGVSLRGNYKKRSDTWDPGLEMATREARGGKVEVKVRATVTNPPHNHDKKVTILIEVLNGEDLVEAATIGPLEAEDNGNDVKGQTTLVLPPGALKTDPMTRLRITVTAKDD